mmetsp:Transcript_33154/g.69752  ORF Transcript_33154/g.69752 Transcript_33154/m.69752 type:complete len:250 (+) Transcript_33154:886-1635(+)
MNTHFGHACSLAFRSCFAKKIEPVSLIDRVWQEQQSDRTVAPLPESECGYSDVQPFQAPAAPCPRVSQRVSGLYGDARRREPELLQRRAGRKHRRLEGVGAPVADHIVAVEAQRAQRGRVRQRLGERAGAVVSHEVVRHVKFGDGAILECVRNLCGPLVAEMVLVQGERLDPSQDQLRDTMSIRVLNILPSEIHLFKARRWKILHMIEPAQAFDGINWWQWSMLRATHSGCKTTKPDIIAGVRIRKKIT